LAPLEQEIGHFFTSLLFLLGVFDRVRIVDKAGTALDKGGLQLLLLVEQGGGLTDEQVAFAVGGRLGGGGVDGFAIV